MTDNGLTHEIIGAAIEAHWSLGPGWLESAHEECMVQELTLRGSALERQKPLPAANEELKLACGYRADLFVGRHIVAGLRAIAARVPFTNVPC